MSAQQLFLLSPARCGGRRAGALLRPASRFPLAERFEAGTLTLGEAFTFMSGLYFRGKLTYARTFGRAAAGSGPAVLVITPTRGLMDPDAPVDRALIEEFAGVDVSADEARYREPLVRDVAQVGTRLVTGDRAVLLGSIATGKYVDILAERLGDRLHYPAAFVGRGDMSRGGVLLRSVAMHRELEYAVLDPAGQRTGRRPPRLEPLRTRAHGRT